VSASSWLRSAATASCCSLVAMFKRASRKRSIRVLPYYLQGPLWTGIEVDQVLGDIPEGRYLPAAEAPARLRLVPGQAFWPEQEGHSELTPTLRLHEV
jgi:hypothetical protein